MKTPGVEKGDTYKIEIKGDKIGQVEVLVQSALLDATLVKGYKVWTSRRLSHGGYS